MTIPAKVAGGLSLFSCIRDIHKTALIYSNKAYMEASSDAFIRQSIGAQKANRISYKDANRKEWLRNETFTNFWMETAGMAKGYCKGLAQGIVRYAPNFILSALAIIPSAKTGLGRGVANLAAVGLMGLEIADFVQNSTNIGQRTDYLSRD